MCNSLKYIHSSCVTHRNLKPENIYIDDSDLYVLGDFGICMMMSDLRESKLIGNENYMAPELWDSDYPLYTPATDIFAFGCILYEIYTLHLAYPGRDLNEIREKIFDKKPLSFERHNEKRIPQLEVLIIKMLDKNPLSRIDLESIDKQFNPWNNIMNTSTISLHLPLQEGKEDNSQQQQQQQQQYSSSDESVECRVFHVSRNKSMLSKSVINHSNFQINDFDNDDEEDNDKSVNTFSFLEKNEIEDNDSRFIKRSKRVAALYLSLGSLSSEKIIQFYLDEKDLNGKLISDYLKMTQKEIDDFDFMEFLPVYIYIYIFYFTNSFISH